MVIIALLLVFEVLPVFTNAFTVEPYYTDDFGDYTLGSWEDIKYIWIDNNESFIMFKVELAAPFNDTVSGGSFLRIFISVDNSTGSLYGDFMADYYIRYMKTVSDWDSWFWDANNASNSLQPIPTGTGLYYVIRSNNDKVIELGYKMQTYCNDGGADKGYLNISLGQRIFFKVEMGLTSDWAPDIGEGNLSYTVKLPAPTLEPILPNPSINGSITLKWNSVKGAIKYYIYRDTSPISSITGMVPIACTTSTIYTDNLSANGEYYYIIVAENDLVNSSISNCQSVTVAFPPKGIPGFGIVQLLLSLAALTMVYLRKKNLTN